MAEPDRRSARDITDALLGAPPGHVQDVLRELQETPEGTPTPDVDGPPRRRTPILVAGGAAVVLAAAVSVYALTRPGAPVATESPAPSQAATAVSPSTSTDDASPSEAASSPQSPTTDVATLVRDFYVGFATSVRDGTAEELYPSLHPLVVEVYGEDRCRTYLDQFTIADFDAEVTGVGDAPEPWTWQATDASYEIPAAFAVDLEITQSGTTSTIVGHVVVEADRVLWFTRCDGAT